MTQLTIYRFLYPIVRALSARPNRECVLLACDLAERAHTVLWRCQHPRKALRYRRMRRLARLGLWELEA